MFSTMAVLLKSGDDKMDMSSSGMDDNWGNDYDDMEGSDDEWDEWEDNEWDDEYDDMQSSAKRLFTALFSLAAVLAVNL